MPPSPQAELPSSTIAEAEKIFRLPLEKAGGPGHRCCRLARLAPPRPLNPAGLPPRVEAATESEFAKMRLEAGPPPAALHGSVRFPRDARRVRALHPQPPPARFRYELLIVQQRFSSQQQLPAREFSGLVCAPPEYRSEHGATNTYVRLRTTTTTTTIYVR